MNWCVFEAGTIVVSNYMYNYRVAIKLSQELLQKRFYYDTLRIKDLYNLNLEKLAYGDLVLGSNQFLLLPQQPQKMILASKVVRGDSKIIISIC